MIAPIKELVTPEEQAEKPAEPGRRRKSERQLSQLRAELAKGDPLWSRSKIQHMSQLTGMS